MAVGQTATVQSNRALTARHRRRVVAGAVGALATTLALLAAISVTPVGAQEAARDDVADRLIQSVTGYTTLPEGDTFGESSGPVTVEELAAVVGMEPPEQPGGPAPGYIRMFATAGDGVAMAIGFEIGQAAEFVAGFRDGALGANEVPLFPDEPPPLGDMVAYEITAPETAPRTVLTAFASGSLSVMLGAGDPDDSVAVLRQMVRDQAALTSPTAHVAEVGASARGTPRADTDEETLAYRLGRTTGLVAVAGVAVWLVIRDTRRRRRAAWATGQKAPTDGPRPYPPPSGSSSASPWAPPPPSPPPPSPPRC